MSSAWPIAKEAITKICHQSNFPTTTFTMADLGCSSGPNALLIASNLVQQILAKLLARLTPKLEDMILILVHVSLMGCRVLSIPGFSPPILSISFIPLLPFIGSQIPEGIENKNKGKIFMSSTSPKSVIDAYYNQFQKDFSMFLKCRAEELVIGGLMILTIVGRTSEEPWSKECTSCWDFLSSALNTMVAEGLLEEEKVDSFNIPNYMASLDEIEVEVWKEGSFSINYFEVSRIDWNFFDDAETKHDFAKCIRFVIETLLIPHFGESIIEELFRRYKNIIIQKRSKEKLELINLTISLIKIK
ncbi:unnamed protein product [Citrullus colocynthis]|uniref:Uncharacterized protein n=1 Tax=Citrullus colocynthis TaxID=252529 RepID=A0ABP0ZBB1_9ROSI